MEKPQTIKHFFFGFAQYRVSDGKGDEVLLKVNYQDNVFHIESLGDECNDLFRQELAQFAMGLLKRKHSTDFAPKIAAG